MREGKRVVAGSITGFVAVSDDSEPRVGLVTPRKLGSAVERNRLRRRLKELLRQQPGLQGGIQLVIIGNDASASHDQLRSELSQIMEIIR